MYKMTVGVIHMGEMMSLGRYQVNVTELTKNAVSSLRHSPPRFRASLLGWQNLQSPAVVRTMSGPTDSLNSRYHSRKNRRTVDTIHLPPLPASNGLRPTYNQNQKL